MFTLKITDEILARAKRNSKTECPLALGILENDPNALAVSVEGSIVKVKTLLGERTLTMDEELAMAVKMYDETGEWPKELQEIGGGSKFEAALMEWAEPVASDFYQRS